MRIPVIIRGLKDAERFSAICQQFPYEFYLRSQQYCIDPKSMLGVLAIFHSSPEDVYIDTNEMGDEAIARFTDKAKAFIVK